MSHPRAAICLFAAPVAEAAAKHDSCSRSPGVVGSPVWSAGVVVRVGVTGEPGEWAPVG